MWACSTSSPIILDKTHLKDHLYETAEELGMSKNERPGWVKPRLEAICNGDVEHVKKELEEEYTNKGVHYCALCDGGFYKDKNVAVVGGADSAGKEALVLTQWAAKVYMIYRGEKIRPEPVTMDRISKNNKIEIINLIIYEKEINLYSHRIDWFKSFSYIIKLIKLRLLKI